MNYVGKPNEVFTADLWTSNLGAVPDIRSMFLDGSFFTKSSILFNVKLVFSNSIIRSFKFLCVTISWAVGILPNKVEKKKQTLKCECFFLGVYVYVSSN